LIETFILFPRGRVEILKATYKNILLSVSELVGAFFFFIPAFCAFFVFSLAYHKRSIYFTFSEILLPVTVI